MHLTDLGPAGSLNKSNGDEWLPINGQALLGKSTIMLGIAPTFTGGASGAITLGTALPRSGIKGYLYFAADTLEVGQTAGFYWVEMTNTTAGVVYNNEYTPGTDPVQPTTLTAFADAIVGGNGVTSEVTAYSITLPSKALGKNGLVEYATQLENNNHADDKILKVKLGATALSTTTNTTTTSTTVSGSFWNAGEYDVQYTPSGTATIDTGAAAGTTLSLTLQHESIGMCSLIPFAKFVLRG
jgi:hypothetical protein